MRRPPVLHPVSVVPTPQERKLPLPSSPSTSSVGQDLRYPHRKTPPSEKLFKREPREYSDLLGKVTEAAFGVRITWHSIRSGGATTRAQAGESVEAIRRFGCWGSEKAVTHYIFPWSDVPVRCYRTDQPDQAVTSPSSEHPQQLHPRGSKTTSTPPSHVRRHRGHDGSFMTGFHIGHAGLPSGDSLSSTWLLWILPLLMTTIIHAESATRSSGSISFLGICMWTPMLLTMSLINLESSKL